MIKYCQFFIYNTTITHYWHVFRKEHWKCTMLGINLSFCRHCCSFLICSAVNMPNTNHPNPSSWMLVHHSALYSQLPSTHTNTHPCTHMQSTTDTIRTDSGKLSSTYTHIPAQNWMLPTLNRLQTRVIVWRHCGVLGTVCLSQCLLLMRC